MKTDSNVYTITYATVLVVIVAVLLAVVSQVLKPRQEANQRLDVQKQILTALNVDYSSADPAALYEQIVEEQTFGELPLYVAHIDGATKYVLRLKGQGLWGGIWGYVALDEDKNTIYGINFGHESETPGLGAEITTENFRSRFFGKHINDAEGHLRSVAVLKAGKKADDGQEQVDAWAGATITSTGVNDMLLNSLTEYAEFLNQKPACPATPETPEVEEMEVENAE
ncbi:MAG: NADH:ubiquinone reductase (Na(+)-transporting) subunit C [Paludibacteraceae bacterium]|nr:NADH:ubiquinone reductase (Na(+)-transporting) subunit C [Paludibacteraceae bacterium]